MITLLMKWWKFRVSENVIHDQMNCSSRVEFRFFEFPWRTKIVRENRIVPA